MGMMLAFGGFGEIGKFFSKISTTTIYSYGIMAAIFSLQRSDHDIEIGREIGGLGFEFGGAIWQPTQSLYYGTVASTGPTSGHVYSFDVLNKIVADLCTSGNPKDLCH